MPPKPNSIQIPKFDAPVTLPTEAITAPDAPMSDSPPPAPPVVGSPGAQPGQGDFLGSVRESNEKRGESKVVQPAPTSDAAPPPAEPSKHDTTPPVFKKLGEDAADNAPAPDSEESSEGDIEFEDPLEAEPVKPAKAKSIKELRSHLNTARAREAQLRTKTEELEAEVQRLAGFQEKMEEYETLKERNAQLETYEKIFDIHSNPEFHSKYIEGDQLVRSEAKQIAEQYGVKDTSVIDHAVKIRNRRDLNDFLKKQGLDELGIQDIRPYIFHLQGLEDERVQLEKSPEQARETLSKMYRENEERRVKEVSAKIHEKSNSAWNQITGYYSRGETAVDLLKEKPGDPEHTQIRTEVLSRANSEYVKVMGAFVGLGTKDIPPAIAHALAARFILSEGFGELNIENKTLKQKVKDLEAKLGENTSYSRPPFNGTSKGAQSAPTEPPKGTAISEHVFNKARDKVNSQPAR